MITLNDYLYSGDTIFRVLQNYITDLREDARFPDSDQRTFGT